MIRVTKWTSDICGCITWFAFDDAVALEERVHTDVAYAPCGIHDPDNVERTLLLDEAGEFISERVRASSPHRVVTISDPARPDRARGSAPMSRSAAHRAEMYLKEDTKEILLNMPEFGRDGVNGREFIGPDPVVTFDAARNLVVDLPGAAAGNKARARQLVAARMGNKVVIR